MSLEQRIKSLVAVRNILHQFVKEENVNTPTYSEFENIISLAEIKNPWFTKNNIMSVLEYWDKTLIEDNINKWLSDYSIPDNALKSVGLVLAGNIPMVGFHDCLCTLLMGYETKIKLSSKDQILIPFFLNLWKEFCAKIKFEFVEKFQNYDAIITTGSNNTAKYFEYYFKNIPHIIRKNRTSIAILNGNETEEELYSLSNDIFSYFGLGCRNVTQIFIPDGYDLNLLFKAFISYKEIINHNKYANNYDYNKAIYLMNQDNFWDNNFILLKESKDLYSPIGTLYYKTYSDKAELEKFVFQNNNSIQCIVSNKDYDDFRTILPGQAQNPKINDYADGVDTIQFLLTI